MQVEDVCRQGEFQPGSFRFKLPAKLGGRLKLDGFGCGHDEPIIGVYRQAGKCA